MDERFDVAVIGGGPTGTGLTIALANAGRSVVVLERSFYDHVRIGETLPPRSRVLFRKLGVWDRFIKEGHAPSPAILSAWGQDDLYENHFIFNPYGHGWHIDRRRFDKMLALVAEEAGASVRRGARVTSCLPLTSGGWEVEFTLNDARRRLRASFLVDATGRASVVARSQRSKRIFYDRLIGLVGFFSTHLPGEETDYKTLVEAAEEGWWYSAGLPNSQMVVAYMTDADLIPKGSGRMIQHWRKQLEQAPYTRSRVSDDGVPEAGLRPVAANSYRMDRITGTNWLAVGDAATAFDPLSSRGIYNALESGLQAARAIERYQFSDQEALDEYELWSQRIFKEYLRMWAIYYGRETRWSSSTFWHRRQRKQDRPFEGL